MPYETFPHPDWTVSDDPARLDRAMIHRFLSEESYWAAGRPRAVTDKAIEGSLCFGLYGPDGQAGFARVVTDRATFAWLSDVFVLPSLRGQGLGKALMAAVTGHPELQGLRRWMLRTRDAHGLYAAFGFEPVADPASVMTRLPPSP